MVREEGYNEGLDALLSGKIPQDQLLEIRREILDYAVYLIPGVGIYRQFKKPKGKRSILGTVGFSIYAVPFIIKVVYLPFYLGIGVVTKDWNPANHVKGAIKKIREIKENKLEKTIGCEEFIKSLEN